MVEFGPNDSEADIEGKLNTLFSNHMGQQKQAGPAQQAKVATVAPPWARCCGGQLPGCDCGESPPDAPTDATDSCKMIDDPDERAAALRAIAEVRARAKIAQTEDQTSSTASPSAAASPSPFWHRHPLLFFSAYSIILAVLVAALAVGFAHAAAYSGLPRDQQTPARFAGALDGQMHAPYDAGAQQHALAARVVEDGSPIGLRSRPMDALGVLLSLTLALYFYWPASFWFVASSRR